MSTRAMRLRNLLVLIAVFASLVALGCWDNKREIGRVLDAGYDTTAQITAAQFQRAMPFAIDGWRPRFVEQALSVDLQWRGKDGKTWVHRKVPVSERFQNSIVDGQQVKLISVPVKVIDDESSVPVLTLDAAIRLDSLKTWLEASGYIAIASLFAAVMMTLWESRAQRMRASAPAVRGGAAAGPRRPLIVPAQRLMIGFVAFGVGGFLTYNAAAVSEPGDDDVKTVEVPAEITSAAGPPYTVQLGWKDGQGGVHHFGPLPVSEDCWAKITRDGKLTVRETKVRVHVDDSMGRPQIIDDAPGARWQTKAVLAGGIVLLLIGAGCLLSAARTMRQS